MLIAILMSLNIVSVGYATWAITGPSTDTTDGGFVSYPVIKSDEYYELTTAMNFQGYFNNGSQGYFILTDENGTLLENATEAQSKTGTITLTYTKKEALTNPTITTTIVFGEAGEKGISATFFSIAQPTVMNVTTQTQIAHSLSSTNGVLSFTFTPKADADVTTITITLNTAGRQFPGEGNTDGWSNLQNQDKMYAFTFNTTVQGTPN